MAEHRKPSRIFDQDFGLPPFLEPGDLSWIDWARRRMSTSSWPGYTRAPLFAPTDAAARPSPPSPQLCRQIRGVSEIRTGPDSWKIGLDVSHFSPEEITIRTKEGYLEIAGDGQVDFEEFVTLLGPKLSAAGMPDKFHGTDFDSVFWKPLCAIEDSATTWTQQRSRNSDPPSWQEIWLGTREQTLQQMSKFVWQVLRSRQQRRTPEIEGTAAATAPPPASFPIAAATVPATDSQLITPMRYNMAPEKCQEFLLQCEKVFSSLPHLYQTNESRVTYLVSLLTGPILDWAIAFWKTLAATTYAHFKKQFKAVFDHLVTRKTAGARLMNIQQGNQMIGS
ncbi:hypothetical protein Z043_124577 [Scleropages formosus]|uniref:DUF4939 domain-containing protein n=1 Tax=Scleropages formosus TaxID=113540 RepID=A0A0P7XXL6_SCLFO|nr:hypothetical protein Z043_124577 [Scleropages formosus]